MPAVVLVEPFDPVNVAAICRVMASFEAGPLIIVRPVFDPVHIDPVIARGGVSILDTIETAQSLEELKERFTTLIATSGKPSSGSHTRSYLTPFELRERGVDKSTAFVFGSESDGLRVSDLNTCDLIVSIETVAHQRALNLSHAVAVMLAITSRIDEPVQRRHPSSDRASKDALIRTMENVYQSTAQVRNTYRDERLETQRRVWKRVIARSDATRQEIRTIMGFLKQCESSLETLSDEDPRTTSDHTPSANM